MKWWDRLRSPEVALLGSNLLARALGFVASLLVSRSLGVASLGVYSGVLITTASPTTPMSAVLANNATMLAVRHRADASMWQLLVSHAGLLLGSLLAAALGCGLMLASGNLLSSPLLDVRVLWLVAAGLVLGQLLSQVAMGVCHGADLSRQAAWVSGGITLTALLLVYPVLHYFGLAGVMVQAMLVAVLPALAMAFLLRRGTQAAHASRVPRAALSQQVKALFWQAAPNMGATVVNNATNWVSCIYLAERFHGHEGLGLVAISLQWSALMLLPVTSWSGRVMRALTLAHEQGPAALQHEMARQIRRCVGVTLLAVLPVLVLGHVIAMLYKADAALLWPMLAINGLSALLAAVNVVYERAYFCLGEQRPWLRVSVLAYAAQMLLTLVMIHWTLLAVAVGNLLAIAMVMVVVSFNLKQRLHAGKVSA